MNVRVHDNDLLFGILGTAVHTNSSSAKPQHVRIGGKLHVVEVCRHDNTLIWVLDRVATQLVTEFLSNPAKLQGISKKT